MSWSPHTWARRMLISGKSFNSSARVEIRVDPETPVC